VAWLFIPSTPSAWSDSSSIVDEYSAEKLVRTETSVEFSVSLASSDSQEHLSTTELSNLRPYTISYPQLKTQLEKLPEELGYLPASHMDLACHLDFSCQP
jgi:hypothetical protein